MNNLELEFSNEVIATKISNYNQVIIRDYYTFLKFLMKLKAESGEKFDDYYTMKIAGNIKFNNQKVTKKNMLIIDLNDFTKMIENLTFGKDSLLKKIYLDNFERNISDSDYESLKMEIENIFKIDGNIQLMYKDPKYEKLLDLMFQLYVEGDEEYLKNPQKLSSIIINYLNANLDMKCIIIIDSSIKVFDYSVLISDPRIFIIDTCVDINLNSNNLLFFTDNEVQNITLNDIKDKIELNWPEVITLEQIDSLIKIYFRIIINNELSLLSNPSDNLVCLYIIVRKMLGMNIEIPKKYNQVSKNICSFINDYVI